MTKPLPLPDFDTVAIAERAIKMIIEHALRQYDTFDIMPAPAGEVRIKFSRKAFTAVAFTTIKLETRHG